MSFGSLIVQQKRNEFNIQLLAKSLNTCTFMFQSIAVPSVFSILLKIIEVSHDFNASSIILKELCIVKQLFQVY